MNSLMKLLAKAGAGGKNIIGEMGNLGRGGKEIFQGGAKSYANAKELASVATQGGKTDALKKLLMANKMGAGALGAGAVGAGGAGIAGLEYLMDDEDDVLDDAKEEAKKRFNQLKGHF